MSLLRILKGTRNRDTGQKNSLVPNGSSSLGVAIINALPDLWIFELAYARSEEISRPGFESLSDVEHELWEKGSSPGDFPGFRWLRVLACCRGADFFGHRPKVF